MGLQTPDPQTPPKPARTRLGTLRMEKRAAPSQAMRWLMPLASVAVALLLGVIPLLLRGVNPLDA
ncbi:MAG TPA: hypothetical protein VIL47_04430, partial [Candidatus Bipolaricaulota bacterium]